MFLNGLNDNYEVIKNHILLMDPLPSMSKSYYLILQIEKQKELSISIELGAMTSEGKPQKKLFDKRKAVADKRNWVCSYCKKDTQKKPVSSFIGFLTGTNT